MEKSKTVNDYMKYFKEDERWIVGMRIVGL